MRALLFVTAVSLAACQFSPAGARNDMEPMDATPADAAPPDDAPADATPPIDAPPVDAPPADAPDQPITVVFQQDVDGYTGTHDTELNGEDTGDNLGDDAEISWDVDNLRFALVRFDAMFGPNAGQIPVGATIVSATLRLTMNDSTDAAGSVREVRVPWDEQTVTFDTFGAMPGVQGSDHGPQVAAAPTTTGANDLVLTASVQAWANSPAANFGWIFIPASNNAIHAHSSEFGPITDRPRLTVVYLP